MGRVSRAPPQPSHPQSPSRAAGHRPISRIHFALGCRSRGGLYRTQPIVIISPPAIPADVMGLGALSMGQAPSRPHADSRKSLSTYSTNADDEGEPEWGEGVRMSQRSPQPPQCPRSLLQTRAHAAWIRCNPCLISSSGSGRVPFRRSSDVRFQPEVIISRAMQASTLMRKDTSRDGRRRIRADDPLGVKAKSTL